MRDAQIEHPFKFWKNIPPPNITDPLPVLSSHSLLDLSIIYLYSL